MLRPLRRRRRGRRRQTRWPGFSNCSSTPQVNPTAAGWPGIGASGAEVECGSPKRRRIRPRRCGRVRELPGRRDANKPRESWASLFSPRGLVRCKGADRRRSAPRPRAASSWSPPWRGRRGGAAGEEARQPRVGTAGCGCWWPRHARQRRQPRHDDSSLGHTVEIAYDAKRLAERERFGTQSSARPRHAKWTASRLPANRATPRGRRGATAANRRGRTTTGATAGGVDNHLVKRSIFGRRRMGSRRRDPGTAAGLEA